jgi:hypothetical protein
MAVWKKRGSDGPDLKFKFGVAFVDTFVRSFQLGQFEIGRFCSRLLTLTTRYNPAEIICRRVSFEQSFCYRNSVKETQVFS